MVVGVVVGGFFSDVYSVKLEVISSSSSVFEIPMHSFEFAHIAKIHI